MKKIISVFLLFGFCGQAWTCIFSVDCEPGSKCVKAQGEYEGICVGGISPGNRFDDTKHERRRHRYDHNSYGDTCQFAPLDCDPGYKCLKERGSIYGVCIKRR